jgi:hypothetical protein
MMIEAIQTVILNVVPVVYVIKVWMMIEAILTRMMTVKVSKG